MIMKMLRLPLCKSDQGGVTFIEVLATITMVAVAAVTTTYALFYGNRALDVDMHKQQVLRMVQQEVEYWVGRIYVGSPGLDPSELEMTGSVMNPYRTTILDPQAAKPIQVKLFKYGISGILDPNPVPGGSPTAYYRITIWAEWTEPDGQAFRRTLGSAISLTTYVASGG
jgi:hypothetical protein